MIQTQTFALDDLTRARLKALASDIEKHKDDRDLVVKLIAEQDRIMRGAQTKMYDPREETKWA